MKMTLARVLFFWKQMFEDTVGFRAFGSARTACRPSGHASAAGRERAYATAGTSPQYRAGAGEAE